MFDVDSGIRAGIPRDRVPPLFIRRRVSLAIGVSRAEALSRAPDRFAKRGAPGRKFRHYGTGAGVDDGFCVSKAQNPVASLASGLEWRNVRIGRALRMGTAVRHRASRRTKKPAHRVAIGGVDLAQEGHAALEVLVLAGADHASNLTPPSPAFGKKPRPHRSFFPCGRPFARPGPLPRGRRPYLGVPQSLKAVTARAGGPPRCAGRAGRCR
jgi:hypothetical protein